MLPDEVAKLMRAFRAGDRAAAEQLVEYFYPELRRMAAGQLRNERSPHTWQPTALVHELYLQLVKWKALGASGNVVDVEAEKRAFFALAATVMRNLLIVHSRPMARKAPKAATQDLEIVDTGNSGIDSLQEVDSALNALSTIDPALRSVVEMRVFEGRTTEEIANQLGCSPRTVARQWDFARHWLERRFADAQIRE
jgi:RNA polymerase sigma factor (TIGR02999 family)